MHEDRKAAEIFFEFRAKKNRLFRDEQGSHLLESRLIVTLLSKNSFGRYLKM